MKNEKWLGLTVLFIENVKEGEMKGKGKMKEKRKERRREKEGRGWYMVADCVMLMMKEREKE